MKLRKKKINRHNTQIKIPPDSWFLFKEKKSIFVIWKYILGSNIKRKYGTVVIVALLRQTKQNSEYQHSTVVSCRSSQCEEKKKKRWPLRISLLDTTGSFAYKKYEIACPCNLQDCNHNTQESNHHLNNCYYILNWSPRPTHSSFLKLLVFAPVQASAEFKSTWFPPVPLSSPFSSLPTSTFTPFPQDDF